MDHQLQLLIDLYEEEKEQLQQRIDACLADQEYLMAHYHSRALFQVNRRLQTLHNINDPLYDRKSSLQRSIHGLQKRFASETNTSLKNFYQEQISNEEKELEKLSQFQLPAITDGKKPLLRQTLERLLEKEIKNLELVLHQRDNLLLQFSYSKQVLKIVLPRVKQLCRKGILNDYHIDHFENAGFQLTQNRLTLLVPGIRSDIPDKAITILSGIVFDLFYFKDFAQQSYIRFTETKRS